MTCRFTDVKLGIGMGLMEISKDKPNLFSLLCKMMYDVCEAGQNFAKIENQMQSFWVEYCSEFR